MFEPKYLWRMVAKSSVNVAHLLFITGMWLPSNIWFLFDNTNSLYMDHLKGHVVFHIIALDAMQCNIVDQ